MEEVREIAERALKEVREVVRGRRAIYLDAELAGLQSVLRAAGVAYEVTGNRRRTARECAGSAGLGGP